MIPEFDLDARGDVICFPLVRFLVKTAFATACLMKLEYARDEEELLRASRGAPLPRHQLALTPVQCRALAADLLAAAEELERPPAAAPN